MLALVTGGVKGLGCAFAKELSNRGYQVIATYLNSELEARELMMNNKNIRTVKCDVRDEAIIKELISTLDKIDLLINNAAIVSDCSFQEKSAFEFMNTLNTNVVGPFLMIKHATKKMDANSTIINISSNNTLGNHNPLSMDYDVSKSALNMLTLDMHEALKDRKIKIFAIAPGWIDTEAIREMNPLYLQQEMNKVNQEKLLEPHELAKHILDHMPEYASGQTIEIKEL